jgi:hypothetical protein
MIRDVPEAELRAAQRAGAELQRRAFRDYADPSVSQATLWWLHRRTLPDGRVLHLTPYGRGLLYLQVSRDSQAQVFTDTWCYDVPDLAWRAVLGWDGEGEPEGWFRHPQSGRRMASGGPSGLDTGLRYAVDQGVRQWVDRGIINPAVIEGQGGAGSAHSCPRCGVFFGTYIAGDAAVALRCAGCGYTIEQKTPNPQPYSPIFLSLEARWNDPGCSREQVVREALELVGELIRNAHAERVALLVDVQRLRERMEEYAKGVVADDLLRELGRQNERQAATIGELQKQTMCWHCHDALAPAEPPHCEQCPGFERCDAPACPEPGCAQRTGQSDDD